MKRILALLLCISLTCCMGAAWAEEAGFVVEPYTLYDVAFSVEEWCETSAEQTFLAELVACDVFIGVYFETVDSMYLDQITSVKKIYVAPIDADRIAVYYFSEGSVLCFEYTPASYELTGLCAEFQGDSAEYMSALKADGLIAEYYSVSKNAALWDLKMYMQEW